MMLSTYPACFFKEKDGYSVIFPDLNYTATCGRNLDEVIAMAVDCLAGYLYISQKQGEDIPAPSPASSISAEAVAHELGLDTEYSEAFVNLISVDVKEYAKKHFEKSVKKTLSIPAWLNEAACSAGINFSQTLQEALLKKIRAK